MGRRMAPLVCLFVSYHHFDTKSLLCAHHHRYLFRRPFPHLDIRLFPLHPCVLYLALGMAWKGRVPDMDESVWPRQASTEGLSVAYRTPVNIFWHRNMGCATIYPHGKVTSRPPSSQASAEVCLTQHDKTDTAPRVRKAILTDFPHIETRRPEEDICDSWLRVEVSPLTPLPPLKRPSFGKCQLVQQAL